MTENQRKGNSFLYYVFLSKRRKYSKHDIFVERLHCRSFCTGHSDNVFFCEVLNLICEVLKYILRYKTFFYYFLKSFKLTNVSLYKSQTNILDGVNKMIPSITFIFTSLSFWISFQSHFIIIRICASFALWFTYLLLLLY